MVRIQKHPIGFKKITLLSLFGYKLRLHSWPNGNNSSRPDIHDHRWPFLSIPLLRSFTEKRYKRVSGSKYKLRHCYTEPLNAPRMVKTVGKGNVKEVFKKIRKPFIPYICPAGEVHSYMPNSNKKSMSLVITGSPIRDYAEVWHEPNKRYVFYND